MRKEKRGLPILMRLNTRATLLSKVDGGNESRYQQQLQIKYGGENTAANNSRGYLI